MLRYSLVFGSIAGAIVAGVLLLGFLVFDGGGSAGSALVGYLVMLLAFSLIFVAVKRYRDQVGGGVIRFWPALWLGVQISLVAGVIYVVAWEFYLATRGGNWMEAYMQAQLASREAAGATPESLAAFQAEMEDMVRLYAHWWFRMPVTLSEILPVGLVISLISATVLRNPNILPRRA